MNGECSTLILVNEPSYEVSTACGTDLMGPHVAITLS